MIKVVRVTFLKIGFLGVSNLIEALLDERASRRGFSVRVVSTGCKMDEDEAMDAARLAASIPSDLYVVVSPNATLPGPKAAREVLRETGKPIIVVSDEPTKKIADALAEDGFGFILIYADSMIGARREFLDPVEMALFNSDILRVLAVTGPLRLVHMELDRVIAQIESGEQPELPRVLVTKERAVKMSGLNNPYAYAKAMASFEMARRVASLSTEGCFRVKERERYLPIVAAAHELMRWAALLADEAREIEKSNDSVTRIVHFKDGSLRRKRGFHEKFERLNDL